MTRRDRRGFFEGRRDRKCCCVWYVCTPRVHRVCDCLRQPRRQARAVSQVSRIPPKYIIDHPQATGTGRPVPARTQPARQPADSRTARTTTVPRARLPCTDVGIPTCTVAKASTASGELRRGRSRNSQVIGRAATPGQSPLSPPHAPTTRAG